MLDQAESPMYDFQFEMNNTPDFKDMRDKMAFVITNVKDPVRMRKVFETYHPQVVFHAAAYKHVPFMEENAYEAVFVNVFGTKLIADLSVEYGVEKFVMISTDKAVNPTNVMGASKRICEMIIQSFDEKIKQGKADEIPQIYTHRGGHRTPGSCDFASVRTEFVAVRFGNVLGRNGSVVPIFKRQIEKGGPVTVTHPDIVRFFMTIPEACRLVMEAATMSTGNQIFIFDMGEPVKIDTLARNMISLAGLIPDKDIKIEYTGLRPGEKLYEEVLANSENTLPAFHERIRIAKVRSYDYKEAYDVVAALEVLSRKVDIENMVILMKKTVPEYKSKNSRFEIYDKN
jgi:FlaA1/EpsC-like NDP-sugar epimerase